MNDKRGPPHPKGRVRHRYAGTEKHKLRTQLSYAHNCHPQFSASWNITLINHRSFIWRERQTIADASLSVFHFFYHRTSTAPLPVWLACLPLV